MVTSLNLARSEAVNRERRVVVRKTGANWENGWQVFVDISRAGANADVFDDNGDTLLCEANEDCLLRVHEPIQSSFTLRGSNNFVDYVRYQSDGTISVIAGGSFVICDNSDGNNIPEAYTSRLILVNGVGRTQMGADADNNGIPEKEDGTEISSCIAGF